MDVIKETVYQSLDTLNTLPSVMSSTQQKIQNIPNQLESTKSSLSKSAIQVRESVNRTLVSIAGIPKGIETNIQTVSKVSEDVLETVSTIPDILDANVKVISAIPADLTSKANSLVEKTTNFPSHVQTEVNSTITRIQMDLEERKKRIIAAAVLIKSIALFPYEASLKVISVLEIISSQINELRSELAGEITPEKAERLRQRALSRRMSSTK